MLLNKNEIQDFYWAWRDYTLYVEKYGGRRCNAPEKLTESIAALAMSEYKGWDVEDSETGDLFANGDVVEVKASGCDGADCSSFGPTEYFSDLVFVKINPHTDKAFVFHCGLNSDTIRDVQVSRTQTFGEQADQGRRPRFSIEKKILTDDMFVCEYDLG